jgi:hypothetical protein
MFQKVRNISLVTLTAVFMLLIVAVLIALPRLDTQAAGGDPGTGTVVAISLVTFADGTTPISTTTYFGAGNGSGSTSSSTRGYDARYWYKADVFVTADVSGTNTITVTPQWSADNVNWVDAEYTYLAETLAQTTSVVTGTEIMTATSTTSSSTSEQTNTYQLVLSADGTDFTNILLRGAYLRFRVSAWTTTLQITPTIYAVLRNDGGR